MQYSPRPESKINYQSKQGRYESGKIKAMTMYNPTTNDYKTILPPFAVGAVVELSSFARDGICFAGSGWRKSVSQYGFKSASFRTRFIFHGQPKRNPKIVHTIVWNAITLWFFMEFGLMDNYNDIIEF
jgi:hypothetical protein